MVNKMASTSSKVNSVQLIATKAGMENVNMEKVNEIVLQASKGSKFYIRQQEQQAHIDKKIEEMKLRLSQLTDGEKLISKENMDKLAIKLEMERDTDHVIVHIDMDAFFAAVEIRDCPQLASIPMAVGSLSMLSTSNYLARKFGVRAAMPGFIAKKLCPELTIVTPNYTKYTRVSKEVRAILVQYDSDYCSMSLDEAYLDITQHVELEQQKDCSRMREEIAEQIVAEIREKIFQRTNLTCSAGISVNTRLAKVCSDINKPNGQFCTGFQHDKIKEFVEKLPIRKISGIGKVTEQQLNALGVTTCGGLWEHRAILGLLFSEITFETFLKISLGLGRINLSCDDPRKSMSTERTFKDMWRIDDLKRKCHELCVHLSEDLKKESVVGKTVGLKIKTVSFHIKTRAKTMTHYTSDAEKIYNAAVWLLEQEIKSVTPEHLTLRLMGVRISSLLGKHEVYGKQLTLEDIIPICKPIQELELNQHPIGLKVNCDDRKTSEMLPSLQMDITNGNPQMNDSETSAIRSFKSNHGSQNPHDNVSEMVCPICNKKNAIKCFNNEDFNRHIDECLSKSTIHKMIKEMETERHAGSDGRKRLLPQNKTRNKRNKFMPPHNSTTIDMFFKF